MNRYLLLFLCSLFSLGIKAQKSNNDENLVPQYTLPDVLKMENGKKINTLKEWESQRRPEVFSLFEEHVYGKVLKNDHVIKYTVVSVDKNALEGKATRKEISIFLKGDPNRKLNLLIYLPNHVKKAVPVFVGLNFKGNQTIHFDQGITVSSKWTRFKNQPGFDSAGIANEGSRGQAASRWPVEAILARGYGLVTAYYGDLQEDRKDIDNSAESFHKWFYGDQQVKLKDNEPMAISIWAWGLSKALDYLVQDKAVDAKKVAVIGHSRLGKAALWAGAQDQRFAMVISNNSGEGGAAITRRKFGETIQIMNTAFPHWFTNNFKKYSNKENDLPVDFHQLAALIAPRPLYVASAAQDLWADPKGEYLSLYHAGPVYQLYGKKVLKNSLPPAIDQPVLSGVLGYHNRTGKHDITLYDWSRYLDFADTHLK
jgi:hypothetical protein